MIAASWGTFVQPFVAASWGTVAPVLVAFTTAPAWAVWFAVGLGVANLVVWTVLFFALRRLQEKAAPYLWMMQTLGNATSTATNTAVTLEP